MNAMIEAMTIALKYVQEGSYEDRRPFQCEHDTLYFFAPGHKMFKEDLSRLRELGFFWEEENERFVSYRFGSC